MKAFCLILFILFHGLSFSQPQNEEIKLAFNYLNRIRKNPAGFSKKIGVDLSKVQPRPELIWNDTLATVAVQKAIDMGKNNYFAHVNTEGKGINLLIHEAGYKLAPEWISDKKNNYFESINAGTESCTEAIKDLILDTYDKGKGHRKHLLGMNDFYKELTHIGIGHVKVQGSKYDYYTVVIIAKQQ